MSSYSGVEKVCRNCGDKYKTRHGRGLCRMCWVDEAIRLRYSVLSVAGIKRRCDTRVVECDSPEKICKNCGGEYKSRNGRGLCRTCWSDISIKRKYHKIATFGGNVHTQMTDFLSPELMK